MNIKIKNNNVGNSPSSQVTAYRKAVGCIPAIYDEIKEVFKGQDKVLAEYQRH